MAHPKQQVHPEDFKGPEATAWLASHKDSAVTDLRLKFGLKRPYASWITQLEVQRKYANKFPSLLLTNWIFPTGQATEQSSSERTAHYKASLIASPFTIDLCAGMGIDSWAFTQRNGSLGHFANELDPGLSRLLEFNLKNTTHTAGTATSVLHELKRWLHEKDISPSEVTVYLDPDRRTGTGKSVALRDASPNIIVLQQELLTLSHTLMTKHSPMVDLNALHELEYLSEIHVVEYQGECKEVLAIQREGYIGQPIIKAILLQADSSIEHSNTHKATALSFVNELDQFLIQPGPALAKSKLHEGLATKQHWKKWTVGNLYTTDELLPASSFYKRYKVIEVAKPYKLKLPSEGGAIERIGYPEHPDVIRKKLGWKEGRENKLFAVKQGKDKLMVLVKRLE
ncbi:MAG: hypothetical protein P8O82_06940 [Schleiferiaceae bacterium]|jgi:hypothetical protein|nr:hypothetical protein [Schleiferiaceae bacterium]